MPAAIASATMGRITSRVLATTVTEWRNAGSTGPGRKRSGSDACSITSTGVDVRARKTLGEALGRDQDQIGRVTLFGFEGLRMADHPDQMTLSGRPADGREPVQDEMDVTGARREGVGSIERLHLDVFAAAPQRGREIVGEMRVAPARRDLR